MVRCGRAFYIPIKSQCFNGPFSWVCDLHMCFPPFFLSSPPTFFPPGTTFLIPALTPFNFFLTPLIDTGRLEDVGMGGMLYFKAPYQVLTEKTKKDPTWLWWSLFLWEVSPCYRESSGCILIFSNACSFSLPARAMRASFLAFLVRVWWRSKSKAHKVAAPSPNPGSCPQEFPTVMLVHI